MPVSGICHKRERRVHLLWERAEVYSSRVQATQTQKDAGDDACDTADMAGPAKLEPVARPLLTAKAPESLDAAPSWQHTQYAVTDGRWCLWSELFITSDTCGMLHTVPHREFLHPKGHHGLTVYVELGRSRGKIVHLT